MSRLRPIGLQALKILAESCDAIRPPREGLVVLLYHRVGRRRDVEFEIDPNTFRTQMAQLAGRVGSLDDAVQGFRNGNPPTAGLAITFDDGSRDFVDAVVPELVNFQVPATLYIATDYIERGRPFNCGALPASWRSIRDAMATGLVSVGSHSHTHALFDRISLRTAVNEIRRSVGLIEDRLGVTPLHFAYPKSILGSSDISGAVRQTFQSAAVAGCRPNTAAAADLYHLARSPIQRTDGVHWFRRKVQGGLWLEDAARSTSHRWRYRHSTT